MELIAIAEAHERSYLSSPKQHVVVMRKSIHICQENSIFAYATQITKFLASYVKFISLFHDRRKFLAYALDNLFTLL